VKVAMMLQNEPYPQDVRVRSEAETLTAAGHRVTVYAPVAEGQPRAESVNGVGVRRYRIPEASGGVAGFAAEYAAAHAQLIPRGLGALAGGADVVHLHNPPDTLFPLSLAARGAGRLAVFDMHDLFPELVGLRSGVPRLERIGRAAQRASLRSATAVIVTNESQRDVAVENGDIAPEKVTVVRNGPVAGTLAGARAPSAGILDSPRLVFLGALGPQDGVLDLPDLMQRPGMAAATLTVIGDGPCRPELEARAAADPGLRDRMRFLGRVEHTLVPALLAEADVAIDPAPCSEFNHRSTMVKVAEYLAARLPVVAYELRETARTTDGAALLAPCGEPDAFALRVERLARDGELRARLAEQGGERVKGLVWERSAERLVDLYERLASMRGR
jgi:glycosyltransferase involved in cell wall biosynthesis